MPELPEAETIVRQLRPRLRRKRLGTVRHLRADMFHGDPARLSRSLPGTRIRDVSRRGKRVVVELGSGPRLVFGLGMTGHLSVRPSATDPEPHTHLRLELRGTREELRFRDARRFGGIWLLDGTDDSAGLRRLGAEPLGTDLRAFRRLVSRPRQIKALLLDQTIVAGLGNIYCDEALHRAGIHPLARAAELHPDRVRKLHRAVRRVLGEAIAAGGTTIRTFRDPRGEPGPFLRKLRVYDREGLPCRSCRAAIERIEAAGRSTHFCPVCQRLGR